MMWTNLSVLAQKAKDAAALIENEINNSVGLGEVSMTEKKKTDDDGWDKCDVSLGGNPNVNEQNNDCKPKEISFVDLKAAVNDIPSIYKEPNTGNIALRVDVDDHGIDALARMDDFPCIDNEQKSDGEALIDALARIEVLEKQVYLLRDELASAHDTTLKLQNQIDDLEEQNKQGGV